ncbi:hypothetical protein HK107_06230 [Parvularcula sp. ZS-1/3]|uniref:DoxX family membrane protein n=1 Tax=Parvularcula mediterranea TaxID=2732508 RepID=A0A7Y3RKU3_9PROT|nr:hypothetical protein [Parvularcula mediterranea]NNU15919.1 hypothetical protein [Parvularcula mediterranea]
MGSLFIIIARALIVAPFLVTAAMAGLDYSSAASAFADQYPQLGSAYPIILGVQVILGLVMILGLPFHRVLAAILAVVVVILATIRAPFWNYPAAEEIQMLNIFVGAMAQAGGLLLVAVMPKGN